MTLTEKLNEFGTKAVDLIEKAAYHSAVSAGVYFGGLQLLNNDQISMQDPKALGLVAATAAANVLVSKIPVREITKAMGTGLATVAQKSMEGIVYINSCINWRKAAPLIAGVGLVGGTAYGQSELHDLLESSVEKETERVVPVGITGTTPLERLHQWGYQEVIEFPDLQGVRLANKEGTIGRLQRAYRWSPLTEKVEDQYGIPTGTLLAMAMHESYGNPVQPNAGNDGGIGLLHMQGPEAKRLGLNIHGDSHSSHDRRHGLQLKQMIQDCDYDPACISKFDDRGHMLKNLDAAARYIVEGFKEHGTWDKGIMYYRGPGHARRNTNTGQEYLKLVKSNRDKINDPGFFVRAAEDFNNRNGMDYGTYLHAFHSTVNNWRHHIY